MSRNHGDRSPHGPYSDSSSQIPNRSAPRASALGLILALLCVAAVPYATAADAVSTGDAVASGADAAQATSTATGSSLAQPPAQEVQLQEVVVTATKREENFRRYR